MSFIGAIPSSVRLAISHLLRECEISPPVHLVAAGNFTLASILRACGYTGVITACDVSLYSSALGYFLSDVPIYLREREDCPSHLRGLFRQEDSLHMAASIALLCDLREVWRCKNVYQENFFARYRASWDDLMERTMDRLISFRSHIGHLDYRQMCGYQYLALSEKTGTVLIYPPTYKGGYERLEKLLRTVIEWTQPSYKLMSDKDMSLYRQVASYDSYLVVLEKNLPEVFEILGKPSAIVPRGRASTDYIITKIDAIKNNSIVLRKKIKSAEVGPFWPTDKKITGQEILSCGKIGFDQSIRMNELFLSKRISYFTGGAYLSIVFMLDGQIFGKADFTRSTHTWKLPNDQLMIYLMSDLAIPSIETRLSKLVLMSLKSVFVKNMIDTHFLDSFGWAGTTVFSQGPASMKYRGLFNLHKRKQNVDGFSLNYYTVLGCFELNEVVELWIKKYQK